MDARYLSEASLLECLKQNDPRAFNYLYSQYKNFFVKSLMYRFPGFNRLEIEDVCHQVIVLFNRQLQEEKIRLTCKLSSYLYSIGYRLCAAYYLKYYKRFVFNAVERMPDSQAETPEDGPDDLLYARQQYVRKVMDSLGENEIALVASNDSLADIARKTGYANEHSAKSRRYKLLQTLRNSDEARALLQMERGFN